MNGFEPVKECIFQYTDAGQGVVRWDEEITRCRDCKYNDKVINACDHPQITPLRGDCPENWIFSTAPDGFCAWGKRIVRCRDCVSCHSDESGYLWCYFHGTGFYRKPTDADNYCSKGKRRDA